jgi:hypothetical protein
MGTSNTLDEMLKQMKCSDESEQSCKSISDLSPDMIGAITKFLSAKESAKLLVASRIFIPSENVFGSDQFKYLSWLSKTIESDFKFEIQKIPDLKFKISDEICTIIVKIAGQGDYNLLKCNVMTMFEAETIKKLNEFKKTLKNNEKLYNDNEVNRFNSIFENEMMIMLNNRFSIPHFETILQFVQDGIKQPYELQNFVGHLPPSSENKSIQQIIDSIKPKASGGKSSNKSVKKQNNMSTTNEYFTGRDKIKRKVWINSKGKKYVCKYITDESTGKKQRKYYAIRG